MTMADPDSENPDLVQQHVEKNRKGDRQLAQKPGKIPARARPDDGNPEEPQKVKDREPQVQDRRPDAEETYRQGRQGPK
jgi:hypothetical protein